MWTIPENRLAELKNKPGRWLASDRFEASNFPGVQYSINICPNDNEKELRKQTWIGLHLKYSDAIKIEADFRTTIESANMTTRICAKFEKPEACGRIICSTEELLDPENRFIVDGKMMIKMEGVLTIEKEMPPKIEAVGDRPDVLCLRLWKQEDRKDFAIVANGQQIMAHKNVLAAHSRVFDRMFESGMKESTENKVVIENFSFNIVEMAIKLCYHRTFVSCTTLTEKMELLQFFDKYEIQTLKDYYETLLVSEIDVSNVCILANAALRTNSLKLKESCAEFLHNCLRTGNPIKDFDLLDKDFAYDLLKNSFYHVSK
uniref:BTB domain-containing protein n=1 Tax=Panagrolaimus sp. PS1159 TaxID=55785 RepID=A0AC35GQJ7_9BILA